MCPFNVSASIKVDEPDIIIIIIIISNIIIIIFRC